MFGFGRKKKDVAPKKATNRGRGAGRTRGTRADDLEQVRDKRRPQGVTSPIRDAAKAAKPPTNRVKPPKADAAKTKNDMKAPPSGLANVTGKDKKPGLRRDVGTGSEEKANVTREQLQKTGLSLRDYLNFMDKNNRRPNKSDAAAAKKLTAGFKAKKAKKMMGGGMAMKSKGYSKGGKMKTKGYKAGGKLPMVEKDGKMIPAYAADGKGKMMAGGKVKSKGMAKGGMMKSKGMAKGGAMKTKGYKKGGKVRGAGIARKGVRPAKML